MLGGFGLVGGCSETTESSVNGKLGKIFVLVLPPSTQLFSEGTPPPSHPSQIKKAQTPKSCASISLFISTVQKNLVHCLSLHH